MHLKHMCVTPERRNAMKKRPPYSKEILMALYEVNYKCLKQTKKVSNSIII